MKQNKKKKTTVKVREIHHIIENVGRKGGQIEEKMAERTLKGREGNSVSNRKLKNR